MHSLTALPYYTPINLPRLELEINSVLNENPIQRNESFVNQSFQIMGIGLRIIYSSYKEILHCSMELSLGIVI
jgi:hypothetical protein